MTAPAAPPPVYLDHNATTPLDPRVAAAMEPWLGERWGNPSSLHRFGQAARDAVEGARERVAALIGARPPELIFTSSGSEANNTVLAAVGRTAGHRGRLVISALEHPSVRRTAASLADAGMELVQVAPRPDGVVDPAAMIDALTDDTRLVCLMLANNEIGTLQPVAEVGRECRRRGIPLLTDAVQAAGKLPVDAGELAPDFLTLGAHKFHGPLGAAALWARDWRDGAGRSLPALLLGGSQERRRRASTENVPALVGFGRAAELAAGELEERRRTLGGLRDRLEAGLAAIPGVTVHGAAAPRLPHTSHLAIDGVEGESLTIRLDLAGFAISTGSACASGAVEPSETLLAMGLTPRQALSSIRISFGMTNEVGEVDRFLVALEREVAALRRATGWQPPAAAAVAAGGAR